MKNLFTAIRGNDLAEVKSIIEKDAMLIASVSKGAPKKDIGQSPLQVALKAASTEIVNYLLDNGADVNFIESEEISTYRAPVIHDAINRAIKNSRWNVNSAGKLEVFSTKEKADESFAVLKRVIEMGADVNAKDSYGNSCLDRACLESRQILPFEGSDDRILTEELKADLSRIFALLMSCGADLSYVNPNTEKTCLESYKAEKVGLFLNKDNV